MLSRIFERGGRICPPPSGARVNCWSRRHRLLVFSCASASSELISSWVWPSRNAAGVSGGESPGSDETTVSGLEFSSASARQNTVISSSSAKWAASRVLRRARLALFTIASQSPLKWGAAGGINFHFMGRWAVFCLITSWSRLPASFCSSRLAPTKFFPLSEMISDGLPLRATNRRKARRKLSVSSPNAISKCTALVCKHRNMQR